MPAASPPHPPADLAQRPLPTEVVPAGRVLFRIHRHDLGALWFGPPPGSAPKYRFDAPGGQYGVCYLGLAPDAAFVETFLRNPPVRYLGMDVFEERSLAEFELLRDLSLASLHGPGLAQLGATAEVSSGGYSLSTEWSRALHEHPARPDGIAYRCRHDDSAFAIALFDRARDVLAHRVSRRLHLEPRLLDHFRRRYGFDLIP